MKVLIITNLFPNVHEPSRGIFNKQQFKELARSIDLRVVAPLPWYVRPRPPAKEEIDNIVTYHPRYMTVSYTHLRAHET